MRQIFTTPQRSQYANNIKEKCIEAITTLATNLIWELFTTLRQQRKILLTEKKNLQQQTESTLLRTMFQSKT